MISLLRRSFHVEAFVETVKVVCSSDYPSISIFMADNIYYGGISQEGLKHKSGETRG